MSAKNRTTSSVVGDQSPIRYAIYARLSSEVQNEISLDSQEMMCRRAVAERGGVVVQVYADAAKYGWSLDREQFNQLRSDASKHKFDAIMMWKFDRLARDLTQATTIKFLLRHEYGIKLYCVEGFSEDDDGNPYNAFMEQMLAVMAAFYSKNLSTEVKRAKAHSFEQGKFHGSIPPLGYILATIKPSKHPRSIRATDEIAPGLYPDPLSAHIIRKAFEMYASGDHSFRTVTDYLNTEIEVLKLAGGRPISQELVREMLQNKLYAGYVSHTEHLYKDGFGDSRVSARGRGKWKKGIHQSIISETLFEQCQQARIGNTDEWKNIGKWKKVRSETIPRSYLLEGKCYCWHCLSKENAKLDDISYGRMRGIPGNDNPYYICANAIRGYEKCDQKTARTDRIEGQVLDVLFTLNELLPADSQAIIAEAVSERLEAEYLTTRMRSITETIRRTDLSWGHDFIDQESYTRKREQLQHNVESSRTVGDHVLLDGAVLLSDFRSFWDRCVSSEERRKLIDNVISKVVIKDKDVVTIVFRGDIFV